MMVVAEWIAFGLLGLAGAATIARLIIGPTIADRILALDMITVLGVGAIALYALRTGLYLYADLAVALGLIAFVGTAAFARYLLSRGRHG
jgi:multicomponent Na+:H+ antiporter subunit F